MRALLKVCAVCVMIVVVALGALFLLFGCSRGSQPAQQEASPRERDLSAAPAPLEHEGGWEEFALLLSTSVWASSELTETHGGRQVVYAAENLFDGDPSTCWAEGAGGNGTGESVAFITNKPVERIGLVNGFARDRDIFMKNNRVKSIRVSVIPAFTAPGLVTENDYHLFLGLSYHDREDIELQDTMEMQYVRFPFSEEEQRTIIRETTERFFQDHPPFASAIEGELGLGAYGDLSETGREEYRDLVRAAFSMYCVRLEIADVYPGSAYDDTCLSEVEVAFH